MSGSSDRSLMSHFGAVPNDPGDTTLTDDLSTTPLNSLGFFFTFRLVIIGQAFTSPMSGLIRILKWQKIFSIRLYMHTASSVF